MGGPSFRWQRKRNCRILQQSREDNGKYVSVILASSGKSFSTFPQSLSAARVISIIFVDRFGDRPISLNFTKHPKTSMFMFSGVYESRGTRLEFVRISSSWELAFLFNIRFLIKQTRQIPCRLRKIVFAIRAKPTGNQHIRALVESPFFDPLIVQEMVVLFREVSFLSSLMITMTCFNSRVSKTLSNLKSSQEISLY